MREISPTGEGRDLVDVSDEILRLHGVVEVTYGSLEKTTVGSPATHTRDIIDEFLQWSRVRSKFSRIQPRCSDFRHCDEVSSSLGSTVN
jgi:hypothetical protein